METRRRYNVTFFLDEEEAARFEAFVRQSGMKKLAIVEKAVAEYIKRGGNGK